MFSRLLKAEKGPPLSVTEGGIQEPTLSMHRAAPAVQIKPQAFLALEASLTKRLTTSLKSYTDGLYRKVETALGKSDWAAAEKMVRSMDLAPLFDANRGYIRYISQLAVLFGASRVTSTPGTSVVGLGFEQDTVRASVESFRVGVTSNMQEALVEAGLQLIAEKRALAEGPVDTADKYLGTVLKADKPSALLPFASFMDAQGKAFFNLVSSLHTSRLSAYGYTAEASALGITEYQINEQLDNRICPVCTLMHGKKFQVEDARNFLDTVVRTQDPDELKALQPWPSRSPDNLKAMSRMSTEQLVAQGWHVPPFHPGCRGLLSAVHKVPALGSKEPVPPYEGTEEDFAQFGVHLSPAKIAQWNKLMLTSPAEVVAKLTGTTEDQLLAAMAENPNHPHGLKALSVGPNGVNLELMGKVGSSVGQIHQDYYFRKSKSLYVGELSLSPEDAGMLPDLLTNLYGAAKGTAMQSIALVADSEVGGLALAKYGFAPSSSVWVNLKAQISKNATKSLLASAPAAEVSALEAVLKSDDPYNVFAVADLPFLGKELLANTTWVGELNMSHPESVSRFLLYVGGKS